MSFRRLLILILLLNTQSIIADNNVWNCEQGMDGEWVCQGDNAAKIKHKNAAEKMRPNQAEMQSQTKSTARQMVVAETEFKPVYHQPPGIINRRPGWSCQPDPENETWRCSLKGFDPKGQARVVDNEGVRSGWFAPAYDFRQEEIFRTLQAQLPYDPWMNCQGPSPASTRSLPEPQRENAPMDVHADYSEVFDKEVTSFYGNVDITRADQHIQADMASYNSVSETLDAQGNVYYSEQDLALYSDAINMKLKTDEARLRHALFISPSGPIRGSANVVYRDNRFLSRYSEASFTSCKPGNQDWIIHAERVKMNKKTGKGAAKNAWLEFKGVPFLYTPYISFPLDDRRLSGFLAPTFGSNAKNGVDVEVPYYWNIAPNYDMTVTPRYMARRGGMLRTKFRFLTHWTKGRINLEFVPYDRLRSKPRYGGGFKAQSQIMPNLTSNIDLNYVSDKDYFNDLNNALGFSNTRQLRSIADIRYRKNWLNFVARVENYQTIDRSIADTSKPYRKFPQVQLDLQHRFNDMPLQVAMQNQYTYFYQSSRVSGHRVHLLPSVSFPWQTNSGFVKPKFSVAYTSYMLENLTPGQQSDISRVVPISSVDMGLFFERGFNLGQSSLRHTLEPRAFYLYIPKVDQSNIPLFDTSLYDLNFNSLFRENRFNGPDRIQDANQVTLALTSRLLDEKTGREYLKFNIGEIFYFRNREVLLRGTQPKTDSLSNVIAEVSSQMSDHLSLSSGVQWNPYSNDFTRFNGTLRYRDLPGKIINLGYRYRRDNPLLPTTINQTDFSIKWPLYDNWFAVGRWQYSVKYGKTVESFIGLEKESCCWRFSVLGRQFLNNVSNSTAATQDYAVFVQLELKGLTRFGDKVDQFLEKNLPGYRSRGR